MPPASSAGSSFGNSIPPDMNAGIAQSTCSLLDHVWARVRGRLDGLTDDEYLWEPVANCWSVRARDDRWIVECQVAGPEPAPVTTIAWRSWHVGSGCINGSAARLFGVRALELDEWEWFGSASAALAAIDDAWRVFSECFHQLDDDAMLAPLGPAWGFYATSTHADMLLHIADECIHHGAEMALLRDLFRER